MPTFIPDSPAYVPQEYQIMYLSIDGNLMTEVQSINVVRTDGGADVETLVRDYAGRVKGAAKADITVKGVIPYKPGDTAGAGFSSGGMVTGPGIQLDQTMLTGANDPSQANKPVSFLVQIGFPQAQQMLFQGYIHSFTVDVSVGKQADFTFQASGQFSVFG